MPNSIDSHLIMDMVDRGLIRNVPKFLFTFKWVFNVQSYHFHSNGRRNSGLLTTNEKMINEFFGIYFFGDMWQIFNSPVMNSAIATVKIKVIFLFLKSVHCFTDTFFLRNEVRGGPGWKGKRCFLKHLCDLKDSNTKC